MYSLQGPSSVSAKVIANCHFAQRWQQARARAFAPACLKTLVAAVLVTKALLFGVYVRALIFGNSQTFSEPCKTSRTTVLACPQKLQSKPCHPSSWEARPEIYHREELVVGPLAHLLDNDLAGLLGAPKTTEAEASCSWALRAKTRGDSRNHGLQDSRSHSLQDILVFLWPFEPLAYDYHIS